MTVTCTPSAANIGGIFDPDDACTHHRDLARQLLELKNRVRRDDHPTVRFDTARVRRARPHCDQALLSVVISPVGGNSVDDQRVRILELRPPAEDLNVVAGKRVLHHFRLALDHSIDLRQQLRHRGTLTAWSIAAVCPKFACE